MDDSIEDDYSSGEDSDYIPGEPSGSDSGGEDEDNLAEGRDPLNNHSKGKGKKAKHVDPYKRKRKGGIKLEGENSTDDSKEPKEEDLAAERRFQEERKLLEEEQEKQRVVEKQEKESKRSDDLWKSLLSDVGPRPKAKSETAPKTTSNQKTGQNGSKESNVKITAESEASKKMEGVATTEKTVRITKLFDFAGEEVKVTKDVAVNSSEAKEFMEKTDGQKAPDKPGLSQLPMSFKRKSGGLGSVLGKITKKNKMSVLDKSKMDWDSFKTTEGIEEDLKIHNKGKDGFLQKQDFLMEADLRQYEIERKLRMSAQSNR